MKRYSTATKTPVAAASGPVSAPRAGLRYHLETLFGIDLRSLALFRMGLGALLILDLWYRAHDLRAHYTDEGVMPLPLLAQFLNRHAYLTIHSMNGSFAVQAALFLIAALFALALLLGYRSRTAIIVSWFLLISLQNRNSMILTGEDMTLRVLVFWAMFLPLGACWSLDRALSKDPPPAATRVFSVASAGLFLQVGMVYWFAAILKSGPMWRENNTAVYYALSISQFTTPFAHLMLAYPALLKVLTWMSWRLEAVGPTWALLGGYWKPLRTLMVFVFIFFHLSFAIFLELGLFPVISACCWLAFLPDWFWERLARVTTRLRAGMQARADRMAASRPVFWLALHLAPRLTPQSVRLTPHWTTQAAAAFFLVYVTLWNLRSTDFKRYAALIPTKLDWIGELTRLDQFWSLFAPDPMTTHGWIVMPAELKDGTTVEVRQEVSPVDWREPHLISTTFVNDRWRKYLMRLCTSDDKWQWPYYAQYLNNIWKQNYPPDKQIKNLKIYFVQRKALPGYKLTPWERTLMANIDFVDEGGPAPPPSSSPPPAGTPAALPSAGNSGALNANGPSELTDPSAEKRTQREQ